MEQQRLRALAGRQTADPKGLADPHPLQLVGVQDADERTLALLVRSKRPKIGCEFPAGTQTVMALAGRGEQRCHPLVDLFAGLTPELVDLPAIDSQRVR